MSDNKTLNTEYSLIQAAFWMGFAVAVSFAASFLQSIGYSNAELGIIIAAGNLLSFIVSSLEGTLIDRYQKLTVTRVTGANLAISAICVILTALTMRKCLLVSVLYSLYMAFSVAVSSLIIELCVTFSRSGRDISFSAARAVGSLGYVLLNALLGAIVEKRSTAVLPRAALIIIVFQFVLNTAADRNLVKSGAASLQGSVKKEAGSPLPVFFRENRSFVLLLAGVSVIFFAHNIHTCYVINFVRHYGGDNGDLGRLNAFMALLEIPPMILYGRIRKKASSAALLKFAFIMWICRVAAIAAAPGIPWLYGAYIFQMLSFAVYTPAIVDYVSETIPPKDSAKAQSLAYCTGTLGSVLAGVLGGRMYDIFPMRVCLLISVAVCLTGVTVALLALRINRTGTANT